MKIWFWFHHYLKEIDIAYFSLNKIPYTLDIYELLNKTSGSSWRGSTGSTISSETLYFVDCESADGRSEKNLGSNERYIH